ncbi:MAG: peptidase S8, partial [Micromonosporaceae bacterium]|nr:peptidase S8 [Micromonosporaceae bacterium]
MKMRALVVVAALAISVSGAAVASASTSAASPSLAPISDPLTGALGKLTGGGKTSVMVHGTDAGAARAAASDAGMKVITSWRKVGIVVAHGTASQIQAVRGADGVRYVEGNQKIK